MVKNTSSFRDLSLSPLTGRFDLRSPSGTVSSGDFRIVLNASVNELRNRCRRPGWRKRGFDSSYGFNNQDLHNQFTDDSIGTTPCDQPPVTAYPDSGSNITPSTYISLYSSVTGVAIYYTTDGSDPTVDSTLYTEPFQLGEDETVVKAIGVKDECVSGINTFTYTKYSDFFEFHFLCGTDDRAGVFYEFEPNGQANDYVWELVLSKTGEFDLKQVEIYETNPIGEWITGQAWATNSPVYPPEMDGDPFSIYPLVLFENGSQVNFEYLNTVQPGCAAGAHTWKMYGQPFVPNAGYFRIVVTLVKDGVTTVLHSVIPNVCDCGYNDSYCDYGYGDDGDPDENPPRGCWPASGDLVDLPASLQFSTSELSGTLVNTGTIDPDTGKYFIDTVRFAAEPLSESGMSVSIQPGLCDFGDFHAWVLSIYDNFGIYYSAYKDLTIPIGSWPSSGGFTNIVTS